MSGEYILSIDSGTQSTRALLVDLNGTVIAKAHVPLSAPISLHPGWAEYPVDDYWKALCGACQKLWAENTIDRRLIKGVAITTQRGTVINLDRYGQPLRPAIAWLDQRRTSTDKIPKINGLWRTAFKLAGVQKTIQFFQTESEANWISAHQPDIWRKTDKFLLLSGYLNYRLSGLFIDSIASQVGYIPFDYKRLSWAGRHDWKWQGLSMDRHMLPDLVPPGNVIGAVSASAADVTGIPFGTPLVAAAADKACEVLGAGCLQPNIACLSYGTAATVNVMSARYVEPLPFIPPYPAALPQHHNIEVHLSRGYWMVNWFKEQFGHKEQMLAFEQGVPAEGLLDELIADIPPGSMGLMLQPYWTAGIKVPGPEAKGSLIGFGDIHTRAHVYRAILEGLAYALREGLERIEARSKTAVDSLRVCGGGSQSDVAMQLTADIFDMPAARLTVYEASALGAAITGAVGLGLHTNFEQAVQSMTHIARLFEPNAKNHELYNDLYHRVYLKMYPRLQRLYHEIQQIIGYPELS